MTDDIERYQWRRNKEGGQRFGNRLLVIPLDERAFQTHVRPLLRDGFGETLAEHQRCVPGTTHYSLLLRDDQEGAVLSGVGSPEELRPPAGAARWALRVDSFDSPEARAWGAAADSEIEAERQHAKVLTVEE